MKNLLIVPLVQCKIRLDYTYLEIQLIFCVELEGEFFRKFKKVLNRNFKVFIKQNNIYKKDCHYIGLKNHYLELLFLLHFISLNVINVVLFLPSDILFASVGIQILKSLVKHEVSNFTQINQPIVK